MRRFVGQSLTALLLVVAAVACADPIPPTSAPPTAPPPAHAADLEAPFHLAFAMPRATWSASEPITGIADLTLMVPGSAELSGSGSGLVAFAFADVAGRIDIEPAAEGDCVRYALDGAGAISSPITKSGGFSAEDPNAAFLRAFFADPELHLPAGAWDITAIAVFTEGADCRGIPHELRATIRVQVAP